jgi:NAD(P)-dependent dehydrogenase (short-subunit alcohol dehydrogenase family)
MDLQLKGKTAIVTGGTAGIGLAIARVLSEEGVEITIPGRSSRKLKEALATLPGIGHGIEADLGTAEGASKLIQQVPETDILVNNLGIYAPKEFSQISDEEWLRVFEINVLSGIRLARQYFPAMLKRNWGRVIFISSESGIMTPSEMVHYGMTKTAQLAISRGLAEQTKGTKVTVNTVLPGPTRSEGIVEFLKGLASTPNATPAEAEKEFFEKYRSSSLLQRLIEDREVANLVCFLASPLSSATNGAALRVEGGVLQSIA